MVVMTLLNKVTATIVIRPLDGHKFVLDLSSLIWGLDESCVIV